MTQFSDKELREGLDAMGGGGTAGAAAVQACTQVAIVQRLDRLIHLLEVYLIYELPPHMHDQLRRER